MENLYEIIGSILAAMVVGLLAYLAPRAGAWLSANADNATEEAILRMVRSFARAAEQLLKAEDPDGEKRRQFVWEQLRLAGVEITEAVMNMIEGEVWAINTQTKKALVQAKAQEGDAAAVGAAITVETTDPEKLKMEGVLFVSDYAKIEEETHAESQ